MAHFLYIYIFLLNANKHTEQHAHAEKAQKYLQLFQEDARRRSDQVLLNCLHRALGVCGVAAAPKNEQRDLQRQDARSCSVKVAAVRLYTSLSFIVIEKEQALVRVLLPMCRFGVSGKFRMYICVYVRTMYIQREGDAFVMRQQHTKYIYRPKKQSASI